MKEDNKPSSKKEAALEELGARVKAAQKENAPKAESPINESHAYGMAMRLVAELVSGLIVGMIIGWFLDKALGTKPWMLIVFVFLGLGAGIFNVLRAAKQMEVVAARQREEADKANSNEGKHSG
ncbi:MAG: AtpZ/AtpI family protein [Emcibacter sp.]|nr:AtpZ/AtpI family protein [Emcibacter sp.]